MRYFFLSLLWVYRYFISPLKPPSCRYYPSCSEYTLWLLTYVGSGWGVWLCVGSRLIRCHPWSDGGIDYPVVERLLLPAFSSPIYAVAWWVPCASESGAKRRTQVQRYFLVKSISVKAELC